MATIAASAGGLQAQRPVGDTLWNVDRDYFYCAKLDWFYHLDKTGLDSNWNKDWNDCYIDHPQIHHLQHQPFVHDGNHIVGNHMHTERPIKVLGIAFCADMRQPQDTTISTFMRYYFDRHSDYFSDYFFLNTNDTTMKGRTTDTAILYKPRTTVDGQYHLEKLAAAPWRVEQPHRYIHLPYRRINDSCTFSYRSMAPLYEVMFDSAVVVDGNFVVASTALNNEGSMYSRTVMGVTENMWLWDHPATTFYCVDRYYLPNPDTTTHGWIKYRQMDWIRHFNSWVDSVTEVGQSVCWRFATGHYIFFPIINPNFDTVLCHDVSNLRVAERGAGSATLMWDAGDGGPWIVAYGKIDDAWEDFTFDTVSSPMITLTGLDVGTQYFALVRGYCGVTDEYGEWSSPLEVEIYQQGHDPDPEGIEHPGDLGRFTRLIPNPAHGEVNVVSSFSLSRIELYALDGRKVLEQEADGISTVVDVSGLPSGTYIAALYLPHGVATKKLTVEN